MYLMYRPSGRIIIVLCTLDQKKKKKCFVNISGGCLKKRSCSLRRVVIRELRLVHTLEVSLDKNIS